MFCLPDFHQTPVKFGYLVPERNVFRGETIVHPVADRIMRGQENKEVAMSRDSRIFFRTLLVLASFIMLFALYKPA